MEVAADSLAQFRDAIRAAGLTPPDVIEADGKLRRFPSNGKKSDAAGWYLLHGDGIPAGSFGDWRTGLSQTWRADIGRGLTPAELAAHRERVKAMQREREAEETKARAEARERANLIWAEAASCTAHPYLTRKGITAHGARLHRDALAIPMRADGKIHSLQFIGADGDKRFLAGGRVASCYFSIGDTKGAAALCIAEGYATGATIHEATGLPVAVSFNAGNIELVAKAMREKFPGLPLILCADDDHRTAGNPGLTKATAAARAVGGLLALPDFGSNRPDTASDFNDLAALRGLDAVRACISALADTSDTPAKNMGYQPEAAPNKACTLDTPDTSKNTSRTIHSPNGKPIDDAEQQPYKDLENSEVSEVSEVQASKDGASADTPTESAEVSEVSSPIPDLTERPCFRVFDDWQETGGIKFRPGVWHFATDKDGEPSQAWICSPLHVEAVTFDGQDSNFGRLLRFKNSLGRWREWAMPMEMLRGAGDDVRGELLAMGAEIDPTPKARNLLAMYLQANPPKRRMRCALQVGWIDDSFVLPDAVIGPRASGVIFQTGERGHDEYTKGGTLEGWRAEVAARAVGNPLLCLAVAASFAGPMLKRCNSEGGGIHLVGDSSTGKTTAIEAACATWGGPSFRRSWRATANGMEGAAALFNDGLLALDEISECDPREVGAIVYSLGNGIGKQRAGRAGNARAVTRWRCFILSSGERTVATTMLEGGHRAKAGQGVRMLDIPAARSYGAWDTLHALATGTAFSDAIKRGAATHYGHAGLAFLEKLTRDSRDFCTLLEKLKTLPDFSADAGQTKRAAGRFALLALAGEVATEYGITGWPEGEAIQAAAEGFRAWQSLRGRGNDERRQILERVSGFIERHGDGRFSDADSNGETQTRERAGWWRDTTDGREYLFTAEGMREALRGFDFARALDALQEAEALPKPGADGKRARYQRIGGRGVKVYPIQANKLGADHDD